MAKLTKKQFEEMFREEVLPYVVDQYEQDGIPDKPARREAWNNTIDAYIRDRVLPEAAGNWSHPRWLETYRPRTQRRDYATKKSPAQLDREIADALAHKGTRSHATVKSVRFKPFKEHADSLWVPLTKFREMIVDGNVTSDPADGHGKWAKLDGGRRVVSNVPVELWRVSGEPEDDRGIPAWATYVVWYWKPAPARRGRTAHASKFSPGDPRRYPGYAIASTPGREDDAYFRSKAAALRAAKKLADQKNRRVEVARITKTQDRHFVDEVYPSRW